MSLLIVVLPIFILNKDLDLKKQYIDPTLGYILLFMHLASITVIALQQTRGPRWFVPRKWRFIPGEYDYIHDVSREMIEQDKI